MKATLLAWKLFSHLLAVSFAQWHYRSQWGSSEARLLLIENFSQYPARRFEKQSALQFLSVQTWTLLSKEKSITRTFFSLCVVSCWKEVRCSYELKFLCGELSGEWRGHDSTEGRTERREALPRNWRSRADILPAGLEQAWLLRDVLHDWIFSEKVKLLWTEKTP